MFNDSTKTTDLNFAKTRSAAYTKILMNSLINYDIKAVDFLL